MNIKIEKLPSSGFLPFKGDKLDMTVKEIIPWDIFGRNCQRYIINVTTKKVHWGLENENNRLRGESIRGNH